MKELGLKIFRTSICWSRIYPNGDMHNQMRKDLHYIDLFSECQKLGIRKHLQQFFHYDIPVNLVLKYGG